METEDALPVELQVLDKPVMVADYKHFYCIGNELHIVLVDGQRLILTKQITDPERLLEDTLASY